MKKILAIMMAMVMVFALTVAVAADDVTETFTATSAGWQNSDVLTVALADIADDAVVTFTVEVDTTSGWWQAGLNREGGQTMLFDNGSTELTVTMTGAELKAQVGETDWWQLYLNSDGAATLTGTITMTVGAASAAEPEATEPEATEPEATEPEATEPEAAPEAPAEAPAAAPATGIALAVVPAIVAMAAVAVSKKR